MVDEDWEAKYAPGAHAALSGARAPLLHLPGGGPVGGVGEAGIGVGGEEGPGAGAGPQLTRLW